MAWHLPKKTDGWDLNTDDFWNGPSPSAPGYAGRDFLVSLRDLQPGDAILKSGHMELFDKWVNASDPTQGLWTYAEHDYNRKTEHNQMTWNYLTANFTGIRYHNITGTGGVVSADQRVGVVHNDSSVYAKEGALSAGWSHITDGGTQIALG